MRAWEKKKVIRLGWAKMMKSGKINDAKTGNWETAGTNVTAQHNRLGASHSR